MPHKSKSGVPHRCAAFVDGFRGRRQCRMVVSTANGYCMHHTDGKMPAPRTPCPVCASRAWELVNNTFRCRLCVALSRIHIAEETLTNAVSFIDNNDAPAVVVAAILRVGIQQLDAQK